MILSVSASKVTEAADRKFVTPAQIGAWDNKFDAIPATGSQDGLMTIALYNKLAGIDDNANAYVHPANHDATVITQDATHRFVSDAQIAVWDAKASTAVATTSADGLMSAADKTKLDGVDEDANNYVHPAAHVATMITEDETHRFTTDAEKAVWNAKQDALGFTPEDSANKGQANGYAGLDGTGKVPLSQLPDAAQSQTIIVADETAKDALDVSTWKSGDRVIVLAASDGSREGYIFEYVDGTNSGDNWYQDSDTDWVNLNIDWANIINGPSSAVADIDTVVGLIATINANTTKLSGIAAGAEVNQNAFAVISDGTTDINADAKSDTVTIEGGTNIEVTADAGQSKLTVAVTGKVASAAAADLAAAATKLETPRTIELTGDVTGSVAFDGTGDVQLATTVVELNTHDHEISDVNGLQTALDNKAGLAVATEGTDGLMSAADKTKLNASVNRYAKSIVMNPSSNGQTLVPTGIKTDGSGSNYTDVASIVSLSVNGLIQSEGAGRDFTVSESAGNELEITWNNRHFSLETDDDLVITFNQIG